MIDCIIFCASLQSLRFYYATELPELPKLPNIAEIEKQNPPQIKANDTDRTIAVQFSNFGSFGDFGNLLRSGKFSEAVLIRKK
jgi:hypothetical protein